MFSDVCLTLNSTYKHKLSPGSISTFDYYTLSTSEAESP